MALPVLMSCGLSGLNFIHLEKNARTAIFLSALKVCVGDSTLEISPLLGVFDSAKWSFEFASASSEMLAYQLMRRFENTPPVAEAVTKEAIELNIALEIVKSLAPENLSKLPHYKDWKPVIEREIQEEDQILKSCGFKTFAEALRKLNELAGKQTELTVALIKTEERQRTLFGAVKARRSLRWAVIRK